MNTTPGTYISRFVAVCSMLCMAAMLHAGFAAINSNVLNIQHMASGDMRVADGGWAKTCDGGLDDCDGHLAPANSHDGGPIHHHHPTGESQFGAIAIDTSIQMIGFATVLDLRPGDTARLSGRYVSTPDQPPRA